MTKFSFGISHSQGEHRGINIDGAKSESLTKSFWNSSISLFLTNARLFHFTRESLFFWLFVLGNANIQVCE